MSGSALRSLTKAAIWLSTCAVLVAMIDYVADARMRARMVPQCRWNDVRPTREAMPYLARWCIVERDVVILRLYDEAGGTLLAERMFDYPDVPRIYWELDELGYRTFTDWGAIGLPPSTLDRWRTRLP